MSRRRSPGTPIPASPTSTGTTGGVCSGAEPECGNGNASGISPAASQLADLARQQADPSAPHAAATSRGHRIAGMSDRDDVQLRAAVEQLAPISPGGQRLIRIRDFFGF